MSETLLEVKNLSIAFGGLKAVDNLSFDIRKGEIYALIGPNGAGKTTVFNCITKFYKADQGEVLFTPEDKPLNLMDLKGDQIIEVGIARTFQNVEIVPELSILDNVLVGAHKDLKFSLIQELFLGKRYRKEEAEKREKAIGILNRIGLGDYIHETAGAQSYGIRKQVEIARALMSDPVLLILDEPAAGLNEAETEAFANLIKRIREKYHCTILLIEHDMHLVMAICHRICAISFGKKIEIGTPREIQNHPEVQKAYLGVDEV